MSQQRAKGQVLKPNDIAGKALNNTRLDNVKWMLLSRIRRGDTLKLEEFNKRLIDLLRERAAELEAATTLQPTTVTDWMALALFAEDRDRLTERCVQAEQEQDKSYTDAAFWLKRLMLQRHQRAARR